jgi:hypothetical protein
MQLWYQNSSEKSKVYFAAISRRADALLQVLDGTNTEPKNASLRTN